MQQNLFTPQKEINSTFLDANIKHTSLHLTAVPLYELKNEELELQLKYLIQQERKLLHLILLHIKEVDSRKLYLKKAYPSLFEYLTTELGYSGSAAQRRIEAARLLMSLPKIAELKVAKSIQAGSLNLSQIGEVARAIKEKQKETNTFVSNYQKEELLLKVAGLSLKDTQKQVALVLDIKLKETERVKTQKDDSVRLEFTLTKAQYEKLMKCKDLSAHTRQRQKKDSSLASVLEVVMDEYLKKRPAGVGTGVEVKATAKAEVEAKAGVETRDEVETKAKSISEAETVAEPKFKSATKPKPVTEAEAKIKTGVESAAPAFRHAVTTDAVVEADANTNANADANTNASVNAKASANASAKTEVKANKEAKANEEVKPRISKEVSKKIRNKILIRDQCCQFIDPLSQKKCSSTYQLEVDHIQPRWANGSDKESNLQVLYRNHNSFKYRTEAGLI